MCGLLTINVNIIAQNQNCNILTNQNCRYNNIIQPANASTQTEEADVHNEEQTNNEQTIPQNGTAPLNEVGPSHDKWTSLKLSTNQFYGLLMKKLIHTMRQKRLVFTQMLLPVLLTTAAISIGIVPYRGNDSEADPALNMSMSSYKRSVTLYSSINKDLGDTYAKVVGSSAQLLDSSYNNNESFGLLAAGLKDLKDYKGRCIVAAELSDTNMTGMYSIWMQHLDHNDVLEEKERVSQLVKTANSSEDAIVVDDNLCKSYGRSFFAVSKLSFAVHHGKFFGLLGVNGASKTTTFRMLTGDENRSNWNAYMNNLSLAIGRKQFLSMLGYCPQFDRFVERLSGKEMLRRLFARLRGIPGNKVEQEADKWLQQTGLTPSTNVQWKKYSGGMKRKLSTAMALIGYPAIILLDEPTSGIDPVARRQFWKIISSIKSSDQAIIVTSHSLEGCEALCSQLGIMVNGEIQCLGG